MLFIESRILDKRVDDVARLDLLDRLQEKGRLPLIRSMRLHGFEAMLQNENARESFAIEGAPQAKDLERLLAAQIESEAETHYTHGDLFCVDDHVLFLVFGTAEDSAANALRAGIVYTGDTTEPLRKLDLFCHDVRDLLLLLLAPAHNEALNETDESFADVPEWRRGAPTVPDGFKRFVAKQDIDSLYTIARKENRIERKRASELLENNAARLFLRRAKEAHIEGYAAKLLGGQTEPSNFSIEQLSEVGLLQREVLVSCRTTGYALFRLPSPDALAVVTVSNAVCSECGAAVADERVEEVVAPTPLAAALLEDGSWLVNRLHAMLREVGIPESEIAIAPPSGDGEAHMMVNVCGESFLFILRDGDLTPAFARRTVSMAIDTEAPHVMIIATGTVHNEARVRLLDYARRRARDGNDIELSVVEGASAAAPELRNAFEKVSQKVVAEQLSDLNDDLGINVNSLINARFLLLEERGRDGLQILSADLASRNISHLTALMAQASTNLDDLD
jgi:hypothetical protein